MGAGRKFAIGFWLRLFLSTIVFVYAGIIVTSAVALAAMIMMPLKGSICCETPRDFGAAYEEVRIFSTQGLKLSGWYLPTHNGSVVILLHSYYADRRQTLPVARMLARHGYGVLMYDQRASGQSDGDVRSLGRLDIPDVNRAVAYLQNRLGVDKRRIGVYGCSMGAAIGLVAAAGNLDIAAVAADAPSPLTFDESYSAAGDPAWPVNLPIYALYYQILALRTGTQPPVMTGQAVRQIAPRPLLLISTGQAGELARSTALFAAAGEPKAQWNIPEIGHCAGPAARPAEYEQHLVDFFDAAFLH